MFLSPTGVGFISGAAGGIGAATARLLAAHGTDLLLVDRNPQVEALAEQLSETCPGRVIGMQADVSDAAALHEVSRQNCRVWVPSPLSFRRHRLGTATVTAAAAAPGRDR